MKSKSSTNLNPEPELEHLLPWQQVSRIQEKYNELRTRQPAFPRIQLRGSRSQLRALREAEMAAWESGRKIAMALRGGDLESEL